MEWKLINQKKKYKIYIKYTNRRVWRVQQQWAGCVWDIGW